MNRFSVKFLVLSGIGIFSATARADDAFNSVETSLNQYFREYNRLIDELEDADSGVESYSRGEVSERETLRKEYNTLRDVYLVKTLDLQRRAVVDSVKDYSVKTNEAVLAFSAQVRKDPEYDKNKEQWSSCLRSKGVDMDIQDKYLAKAASSIDSIYNSASQRLSVSYQYKRNRTDEKAYLDRGAEEKLSATVDALNTDWKSNLKACCIITTNKTDECAEWATKHFPENVGSPSTLNIGALTPSVYVPDPLSNTSNLTPKEIAAILRSGEVRSDLNDARQRGDWRAELDVLSDAESACSEAKARVHEKSTTSGMGKSLMTSIGKTLKCHMLPFWGTQSLDTPAQRMTTAAANVEFQGNGWDVNCDPRETAIYDSLRPTDPQVIAQKWGINDQMSNPPWIAMMRNLQPVQSPFPMVALPGAGIVTPYGIVGRTLAEAGTTPSSNGVTVGGGRGTLIPANSTTSSALASNSSVRTTSSSLTTRRAPSRGLASASAATQSIRRASGNVARGRAIAENVSALQSGSSKTRAIAQGMVMNQRSLSSSSRRALNSSQAKEARTVVRGLAGSRAGRTSASSIANAISGYRTGNRTQAAPTNGTGQTLEDLEKKNLQERMRLESLARMYVDNIESAKKLAEGIRQQIFQKIVNRDSKVGGLLAEIIDKPVKVQATKTMNTRKELLLVDRELGQLKAQYDVFVGSVLEQASLLRHVTALGTGNSIGPGNTWDPRMMAATGVNPNSVPANGPQAPVMQLPPGFQPASIPMTAPGFPQVTNPGTTQRMSSILHPMFEGFNQWRIFSQAFAAQHKPLGIFRNEREWRAGFEKFKDDLFKYADNKKREEDLLLKTAVQLYNRRVASISSDTITDIDTDTLMGMELYAHSMNDEVTDVITQTTQGKINLAAPELNKMRKAVEDSQATLSAIDELSLQYKDSYPLSDDENPEVWWAMLPEMLIY